MQYTITKNAEYGSLEIKFDGKPSEAVRDALKSMRFKWHSLKKIWYGFADEQTARKDKSESRGRASLNSKGEQEHGADINYGNVPGDDTADKQVNEAYKKRCRADLADSTAALAQKQVDERGSRALLNLHERRCA
mgnify:CR=1 FL=1